MATLTKKDLLEAIEDMPMDARVFMRIEFADDISVESAAFRVELDKKCGEITIC